MAILETVDLPIKKLIYPFILDLRSYKMVIFHS